MNRVICGAVVPWLLAVAIDAGAGGLYGSEFATPGMGTAGAGATARADDASTAFHNPAGMTRLQDHQAMLGLGVLSANIRFDPDPATPTGGSSGGNQGAIVPFGSQHYVHRLSDRWRAGLGVFSTSASVLDPDSDWAGRFEVTELSLFTLTMLPSVAYRVNDWLSLGGGPAIVYGALDLDLNAPLGPIEGRVEIDGADDWAFGFFIGALVEFSERTRLGIYYQSEVELDLSGDISLNPLGLAASTELELPLAQALRGDLYWELNDRFTLLLGATWEDWSTASTVPVSVASGSTALELHFRDTVKYKLGFHYHLDPEWTLQAGIAYDSSPVRIGNRIASFPIDRQVRYAVGALRDWSEDMTVGFHFTWVDLGKAKIRSQFTRGEYDSNYAAFFALTLNWKKLPWSGRGTPE